MALTQLIKDMFLGFVPSLSLILAIILLQFFSETVFKVIESLAKQPLRKFMHSRVRFIMDLMPNFDSFIILDTLIQIVKTFIKMKITFEKMF